MTIKKPSCILLTVLLILLGMPLSTAAATAPSYAIESKAVLTEDIFTVEVSLADNPGIISTRLQISYDTAYLQLESVSDHALLKGMTEPSPVVSSPYILRWADPLADTDNTAQGTFVTLTFKALKPAEQTLIEIQHIEARNRAGDKVTFANVSAEIAIHTLIHTPGIDPDHTRPGNIEYWLCEHCGKYFRDPQCNEQITHEDTLLSQRPHEYSSIWTYDDNRHWRTCTCGDQTDIADHIFDADSDADCNTCGYVRTLPYLLGDVNNDGAVTDSDAVYLLRHTLFSADYPIFQPADFTRDGAVTDSDAVYLLRHTLFADDYPLDPL